jgi:hypothetical protein
LKTNPEVRSPKESIYLSIYLSTRSKPCQKPEVRKITSLKTSPEVRKITSLKTSPKETNLVKKNCEVRKITSMEKTSPKETTLVKKLSVWPRETSVRVGVFLIPNILLFKKKEQVETQKFSWAGVGGYRRLPDDAPWQGQNTLSYVT